MYVIEIAAYNYKKPVVKPAIKLVVELVLMIRN